MFSLFIWLISRILSNSYVNVFQKTLTYRHEHSSVVNFYTYFGLIPIAFILCENINFSIKYLPDIFLMGFLGAIGNYFIIKALSCGELSTLAPINSYKPIISLIVGIFLIHEIPQTIQVIGILLILIGTLILGSTKIFFNKATLYRFIALILLGTEAVFIKKVILHTDISSTFLYWVVTGFIISAFFAMTTKYPLKINHKNIKYQLYLIILVALMQYSTNVVFSKINVAYALALFQLSTIVSIFLGANIFKEKYIKKKVIASLIMLAGATLIILY